MSTGTAPTDGDHALVHEARPENPSPDHVRRVGVGHSASPGDARRGIGDSRTPVREALRQLQATGMLEIVPRRGAIVHGPSPRDIREAYVVRAELEGLAVQLAAELITDDELRQLREAAALFSEAVAHFTAPRGRSRELSDADWPAANDLFHGVILRAAETSPLRDRAPPASQLPAQTDVVSAQREFSRAR